MEAYLDEWLERHPEYETLSEAPLTGESAREVDDSGDDNTGDNNTGGNDTEFQTPEDQAQLVVLTEQLTREMRIWFNTELDAATGQEICALLLGLVDDDDPDVESDFDADGADDEFGAGASDDVNRAD